MADKPIGRCVVRTRLGPAPIWTDRDRRVMIAGGAVSGTVTVHGGQAAVFLTWSGEFVHFDSVTWSGRAWMH